jgi:hypothetical protein
MSLIVGAERLGTWIRRFTCSTDSSHDDAQNACEIAKVKLSWIWSLSSYHAASYSYHLCHSSRYQHRSCGRDTTASFLAKYSFV